MGFIVGIPYIMIQEKVMTLRGNTIFLSHEMVNSRRYEK